MFEHWQCLDVFIDNFEQVLHIVLVFRSWTLYKQMAVRKFVYICYMYNFVYYLFILKRGTVCIGVATPPQKHTPQFFAKQPLKPANCSNPLIGDSSPLDWFFVNPSVKSWIFQWYPLILKVYVVNPIPFFKSN